MEKVFEKLPKLKKKYKNKIVNLKKNWTLPEKNYPGVWL